MDSMDDTICQVSHFSFFFNHWGILPSFIIIQ
jgi:hypothetical protein